MKDYTTQIKFIQENYLKLSSGKISKEIGMSKYWVQRRIKSLGLIVPKHVIQQFRKDANKREFTKSEIGFIINNFEKFNIKKLAKELKCGVSRLRTQLSILGYDNHIKTREQSTRFKKGHIPPNKGKKIEEFMDPKSVEKFKANQFKKGHKPHNTKHDFSISIRKSGDYNYYWIRLSEGKWELLHRYIWELIYGPIPENHNVTFRDGDSLNIDLDNLELTDRKYHIRVNSKGGRKLDYQTKKAIKLIYKIKNRVHEKQNTGS